MQGPMDFFRSRVDNFRAHPIQGLLGMAGGAVNPLLGQAMNQGFSRYNDHNWNNAQQQSYSNLQDQSNDTSRNIWDKPLAGQLGQFDGSNNGPDRNEQDRALANSLNGSGSPQQGQQSWSYGQFAPQGPGGGWTQQGNPGGLLNFLPPQQQDNSQGFPGLNGYLHGSSGGGSDGGAFGGMGGNSRGDFGMLPGGGMNGVMNGASAGMLSDFAAPTNGDWMARLQTHNGANGGYKTAAQR